MARRNIIYKPCIDKHRSEHHKFKEVLMVPESIQTILHKFEEGWSTGC